MSNESFHTIVVGGGWAGLAVSYYLTQQRENFAILDEQPRTDDAWQEH